MSMGTGFDAPDCAQPAVTDPVVAALTVILVTVRNDCVVVTVADAPGPAITTESALPEASVPTMVKFLPVSDDPPEVIVTCVGTRNVFAVIVSAPAPAGVCVVAIPLALAVG